MKSAEKLIKSSLGEEAESFAYELHGTIRRGWKLYLLNSPFPAADKASALVDASWRKLHEQGIQLFVGPSVLKTGPGEYVDKVPWNGEPAGSPRHPPSYVQVFALPDTQVLDVVEFCEVGTHNTANAASAAAQAQEVQQALKAVNEIAPFAVQFADSAGLRATFLGKVTMIQAKKIAPLILTANVEAMDFPPDDLEELGIPVPMDANCPEIPDYDAALAEYIVAAGKFRMWWD